MKFKLKSVNLLALLKLDKFQSQAVVGISLAVFLIANLLIKSLPWRLDFSQGKAYTLSAATKKIINNLDDIVNIKFFVSSDLPTRIIPAKDEIIDFLNEFARESRGKISVRILDPKKDQDALNQAQEAGIPALQFSQLEQDKYAVTSSYFGILISYGSKKEIIPQATDLESLEYNLTAAIYKLVKKNLNKIAVVGKEESFDPQSDDLATLKNVLRQQFELSFINISADSAAKEISQSYDAILIFDDDKKEYTNDEIAKIQNYLAKNKSAVIFADGTWITDTLESTESKSNLFGFLENWGIGLSRDLVLSTSAEIANFGNGTIQFYAPYPFWVKSNIFNSKKSFFANINQLTFPWVSSLNLNKKSGIESTQLVLTTKNSWARSGDVRLDPQSITQPEAADLKQFVIGALAEKKNRGKIVLIPSSRFVIERYLASGSDNLEFVLNILNELVSGGALTGIRRRAVAFYPLPDLPENQKDIFKYANILLLPGLFAGFGLINIFKKH